MANKKTILMTLILTLYCYFMPFVVSYYFSDTTNVTAIAQFNK